VKLFRETGGKEKVKVDRWESVEDVILMAMEDEWQKLFETPMTEEEIAEVEAMGDRNLEDEMEALWS